MTLDEGPLKAAIDSDIDKVISERFERTYVKNNRLYKTTTTRQYDNTGDYIDTSNTEFLIDVNPHPNCDTDDCCGEWETSTKKQEFDELINNWEIVTKDVIKTISKRNQNLLKDKSSNSLIALGAMEVHLNMALQALNAFKKDPLD